MVQSKIPGIVRNFLCILCSDIPGVMRAYKCDILSILRDMYLEYILMHRASN